MDDFFDEYGTPKYQTAQSIYDGLCELEQSEEISILTEMFPDVSYERQGYYYQDEGSRLKGKFEQITDWCNNMWLMEVALWQTRRDDDGFYPEVHDLVFEVLHNVDFAKRTGFKKIFVETMLRGNDASYKEILEDFTDNVHELNQYDYNGISKAFAQAIANHGRSFGIISPHSLYGDFCNDFYKKLQRMDVKVEAQIISECRALLTSYDDFIRGLRVNQELYNGLDRYFILSKPKSNGGTA